MWIVFAHGLAFFVGVTAVLTREGIRTMNSTVATALRIVVVLVNTWGMVFIVGSQAELTRLDAYSTGLLVLSGPTTGVSRLHYFKALQLGNVSKVMPTNKLNTVLTALLAFMSLGEWVSLVGAPGVALIAVGTLSIFDADDPCGLPRTVHDGGGRLLYALGLTFFTTLTAILSRAGITGVESSLGTATHTGMILVMARVMVAATGKLREACAVPRGEFGLILTSGATTRASWLCYYRVLQDSPVSMAVPIGKLSVLIIILSSALALREVVNRRYPVGLMLFAGKTLVMLISWALLIGWHSVQRTWATQ